MAGSAVICAAYASRAGFIVVSLVVVASIAGTLLRGGGGRARRWVLPLDGAAHALDRRRPGVPVAPVRRGVGQRRAADRAHDRRRRERRQPAQPVLAARGGDGSAGPRRVPAARRLRGAPADRLAPARSDAALRRHLLPPGDAAVPRCRSAPLVRLWAAARNRDDARGTRCRLTHRPPQRPAGLPC